MLKMTSTPVKLRPFVSETARVKLGALLEKAIVFFGADFGNIQRLDKDLQGLEIIVQRGFKADFIEHFKLVRMTDGSACAQALRRGEPVVIQDVNTDPSFEKHRATAAAARFQSVISIPLLDEDGNVIGVCSVHFRQPLRYGELSVPAQLTRDMARTLQKVYTPPRKAGRSPRRPSRKRGSGSSSGLSA